MATMARAIESGLFYFCICLSVLALSIQYEFAAGDSSLSSRVGPNLFDFQPAVNRIEVDNERHYHLSHKKRSQNHLTKRKLLSTLMEEDENPNGCQKCFIPCRPCKPKPTCPCDGPKPKVAARKSATFERRQQVHAKPITMFSNDRNCAHIVPCLPCPEYEKPDCSHCNPTTTKKPASSRPSKPYDQRPIAPPLIHCLIFHRKNCCEEGILGRSTNKNLGKRNKGRSGQVTRRTHPIFFAPRLEDCVFYYPKHCSENEITDSMWNDDEPDMDYVEGGEIEGDNPDDYNEDYSEDYPNGYPTRRPVDN